MKKGLLIALMGSIILIAGSCNGVGKVLKNNDPEAKFAAAMAYYNDGHYTKASQVFENLTLYYRGQEHGEDILWYYGQSLYEIGDYFTAAYQFKRFYKQYPYSVRAEDALFRAAYCQYLESPPYSLDQTTTTMAIADFERYVELYPTSTHIPEVNAYLDELREKLMKKDYEIAYGYYRIEAYHAAYNSLQNFISQYPDSPYKEKAMFCLLDSGYEYAINSTELKRYERLKQVINDFEKFASTFPESSRMTEAQTIYTKARAALTDESKKLRQR